MIPAAERRQSIARGANPWNREAPKNLALGRAAVSDTAVTAALPGLMAGWNTRGSLPWLSTVVAIGTQSGYWTSTRASTGSRSSVPAGTAYIGS